MPRIRLRWLAWALPALLLLGGAGYLEWRARAADAHLRAARAALDHHNYLAASERCDAYLRVRPSSADAHLMAARCARHLGAFDAADQHLNAARRADGDSATLALENALLDVQRGQGDPSGEMYLNTLVEHDRPETSEIFETLAEVYLYRYRLDAAQRIAERWLVRRPDDAQAFFVRGSVWEAMRQIDKARDDYRRAVELDPENVEAGKRLAEVLLSQSEADEALKQFDRLRALAPDDPSLELGAARCHRLLGHTEEAGRLLDALAARQPKNAAVWRERGSVAMDQDRFDSAEQSFRRALAADPFDDVTCNKLAACLRRLDRPDEADDLLRRGKRIEDDSSQMQFLTEEVGRRPADPAPRCEAGVICIRNGQEQEGLRWLLGALQCDPNHRPTRDALADYYERHGDAKAAADYRGNGH